MSGLALISVEGLLDLKIENVTINGDSFYDYIQKHVLPYLMPFNSQNTHSVFMDNCAIQHVEQIASMIQDVGSLVHYSPLLSRP